MIGSVRGRLTVAVAVVVGGLAVAAALLAPATVRNALIDDRLDAEVEREADTLAEDVTIVSLATGRDLGTPELTALFGPEIAALTDSLAGTGALVRLQSYDATGHLYVTPMAGVVGTVEPDGTVRVDQRDPADVTTPLVTVGRLEELAIIFGDTPRFDTPLAMFEDESLTFEDFVADLDARFGEDVRERLDGRVFEQFPLDLGDVEIPRDVFEILRDELLAGRPDPAAGPEDAAVSVDDYVFGVREAGRVEVIVTASADGIERSVDRVQAALWLAVPVAVLLAGGVTWLLAGRALQPVRAITERTARIRSSTLHERVPVPAADDEVAALATEMNTMLDRVQREDERRRQFVADASHELRSPIAAIRAQAEATLATATTEQEVELATGVLAEAERMGTLVDDLLSLARHDEGLTPPRDVVDLDDIVLTEAARPRRLPVDVSRVSAGRVRARPDELTRVVTHLLDNAVRHADQRVAVALGTSDGVARLTVDDDGPGVPADQRERVFERFVRLDAARERDAGGAGLGLAVVAEVVRGSGGTVRVTSSDLGGARFELTLPAAD